MDDFKVTALPSLLHSQEYWNTIGSTKEFEDPLYLEKLTPFLSPESLIVEYGCGYGRLMQILKSSGYENLIGFDFAPNMIKRGLRAYPHLDLRLLEECGKIPCEDGSVDAACDLAPAEVTCARCTSHLRGTILMQRFTLHITWRHGGASHVPLRAHTLHHAKAEAAAALLEEDVYDVASARLRGGGVTCDADTTGIARGEIRWVSCRAHGWAA